MVQLSRLVSLFASLTLLACSTTTSATMVSPVVPAGIVQGLKNYAHIFTVDGTDQAKLFDKTFHPACRMAFYENVSDPATFATMDFNSLREYVIGCSAIARGDQVPPGFPPAEVDTCRSKPVLKGAFPPKNAFAVSPNIFV